MIKSMAACLMLIGQGDTGYRYPFLPVVLKTTSCGGHQPKRQCSTAPVSHPFCGWLQAESGAECPRLAGFGRNYTAQNRPTEEQGGKSGDTAVMPWCWETALSPRIGKETLTSNRPLDFDLSLSRLRRPHNLTIHL
ncbi:hypothetical protein K437DRAFT_150713 [Tilletiaria anomala UBC 951]|uniref:Uncharacterized protein n=1 Tax=Tilletiaria anomala (strain ATCC 24038 / CBS 436.72 / UBC 951) TaxID=1037660 RepID=A0A066WPI1_TILAU|nr:uncharacterized protein K437DRAFT_150713 [Tilletiaria anomala UBC 951]KDN52889.1 hypothetical protein K437DRAFT_150713 [Tilletiaria anomala UBC 951]